MIANQLLNDKFFFFLARTKILHFDTVTNIPTKTHIYPIIIRRIYSTCIRAHTLICFKKKKKLEQNEFCEQDFSSVRWAVRKYYGIA